MNCPIPTCEDNYIGETVGKHIKGNNGRNHKPNILKHMAQENIKSKEL